MNTTMDTIYIVKMDGQTVLKTYDKRKFDRYNEGQTCRKFAVPANNAAR